MLYGWRIFIEFLVQQRRKKHGIGKRDWLTAIYIAACGQYLVDHQHRRPGKLPLHGRIAQRVRTRDEQVAGQRPLRHRGEQARDAKEE
jgi:hypothetical protein